MSNLKLRLKQLEENDPITPLILFIRNGKYTDTDNAKIKEAECSGRHIKIINFQVVNTNGEVFAE